MSKLYVSFVVVALLALAVMPAIAADIEVPGPIASGDTATVLASATVPTYINLDAVDLTVEFGTLADASDVGYVQSDTDSDTASYTVST